MILAIVLRSVFWDFRRNVSIKGGDRRLIIMMAYLMFLSSSLKWEEYYLPIPVTVRRKERIKYHALCMACIIYLINVGYYLLLDFGTSL